MKDFASSPIARAVTAFLQNYGAVDNCAVACSGGRDSMALLDALRRLGIGVTALHVKHGMRANGALDAELVETYCARYAVPCRVFGEPPKKLVSENDARSYRYGCFDRTDFDRIYLAHHADDNAETVLLHLTRGCGIDGLAGMEPVRDRYARPLLSVTREQVDEYVRDFDVPYRDDESNDDVSYARNRIRRRVLPELHCINPNAVLSIAQAAEAAKQANLELDRLLPPCPVRADEIKLNLEFMFSTYYILRALKSLSPVDVDRVQVDAVRRLASVPCGTRADLKNGLCAIRDSDGVTLLRQKNLVSSQDLTEVFFAPTAPCDVFGCRVRLTPTDERAIPKKPILLFDADKIPTGGVWRTRKTGDVFTPFGGGTRPLKEYLIDAKIPKRLRDGIPLLCIDEVVLIAVGVEISPDVRADSTSRRLLTAEVNQ